MRRSLTVALVFVALLAFLAQSFFPSESTPSALPAPDPAAISTAREEGGATFSPAPITREDHLSIQGIEASSSQTGEAGAASFRVSKAEDGQPLSGAIVHCLEVHPAEAGDFLFRLAKSPNQQMVFAEQGSRFQADQNGRVFIPFTLAPLWISVSTPTHFDIFPRVNITQEERELFVQRFDDLKVRVIDASGRPIPNVPIGFREKLGGSYLDLMNSFTDPNGQVVLRLGRYLKETVLQSSATVAVLTLSDPPIGAELDLDHLPAEGVTLVVPQLGSVAVTILDPKGKPFLHSARVFAGNISSGLPGFVWVKLRPDRDPVRRSGSRSHCGSARDCGSHRPAA